MIKLQKGVRFAQNVQRRLFDMIKELNDSKKYIDNMITSKHPTTGEDIHNDFLRDNSVLLALLQVSRTLGDVIKEKKLEGEKGAPDTSELNEKLKKATAERDALKKELENAKKEIEILKSGAARGEKKDKTKAASVPKQKPRPVRTECNVLCRGSEQVIQIVKGTVTLENILDRINEAFAADGVKVSLNKLTSLLKEKNILTIGKAGSQMRLIPTKLGEYYGVSLAEMKDDSGVNRKVPVYNEHGQYFVLNALSERKEKKGPFVYLPDLMKIVPVTTDEVSLSEIVSRINETCANEPMVQLQFASVTNFLASKGYLIPNPDADSPKAPKYVPAESMRSKGIRFYPPDARHAARTMYNILGQRFVLRELYFMTAEETE